VKVAGFFFICPESRVIEVESIRDLVIRAPCWGLGPCPRSYLGMLWWPFRWCRARILAGDQHRSPTSTCPEADNSGRSAGRGWDYWPHQSETQANTMTRAGHFYSPWKARHILKLYKGKCVQSEKEKNMQRQKQRRTEKENISKEEASRDLKRANR